MKDFLNSRLAEAGESQTSSGHNREHRTIRGESAIRGIMERQVPFNSQAMDPSILGRRADNGFNLAAPCRESKPTREAGQQP